MAEKKSKKKLFIIIVLLLLIIGGGAGGWYGWTVFKHSKDSAQVAESKPLPPVEPIFYEIEPLTVNLQESEDDSTEKFLYIKLNLVLSTEEDRKTIHTYLPQATSRLILLLSSKNSKDLMSADGKLALIDEIKATLAVPFSADAKAVVIDNVLLTNFIIQ